MFKIEDMLDPGHYENVLKPPLEAENLPPWCYTDEDFHRLEIERIFMKVWNLVGRSDLLPEPGSQGRVQILAPQQCVRRSSVGERIIQRGVAGVECVGKHAGGRLVALPPDGLDGPKLHAIV